MSSALRFVAIFLALAAVSMAQQPRKHPAAKTEKAAAPATPQCPIPRNDNRQVYRVIMKDGSYQSVTKCELLDKGSRVHFWSAERSDWEDLPNSLVDWPATEKDATSNGMRAADASASADAAAVDAEAEAERKEEEARSPQIQPGLRLPDQGGVFVLDYWRDQPELVELVQNGGDINKNTGRNILRAAINPIAKSKQTIEIKGAHARVQVHVPQPAIYIDVDSDQNANTGPNAHDMSGQFRIVKVEQKKDSRVVGDIEVAIYGKVSQKAHYIETKAEPVSSQWLKITPAQPLEPSEYAVVEMLGSDINLYVWDFGVNPSAPENLKPWRPAPVDTTTGTTQSPVLNPRPKNQ